MAKQYIIVVYNASLVRRVLRILQRNNVDVKAIALLVKVKDPRVLGGIKVLDRENIVLLQGVLSLPR